MAEKFKVVCSITLFYLLCTSGFSQTNLSPIVGYELTHYIDNPREISNISSFTTIMSPSMQNNFNLLIGLELQQKLGEKFSLAFQHTWSKKHVWSRRYDPSTFDDIFIFSGAAFRYNRNILLLKYNLNKSLSIGLGHSYNRYRRTRLVSSPSESLTIPFNRLNSTPPSNESDYGVILSLSYQIAKLSIELQYHHSYRIDETSTSFPSLFLPPKAISLSLAYKFKVLNAPSFSGWGRQKEGCSTF